MPIDAMITSAIIDLLTRGVIIRTYAQLTKAVANELGIKVTPQLQRKVKSAINRNRHRLTYENGKLSFTIEWDRKH